MKTLHLSTNISQNEEFCWLEAENMARNCSHANSSLSK